MVQMQNFRTKSKQNHISIENASKRMHGNCISSVVQLLFCHKLWQYLNLVAEMVDFDLLLFL